MHRARQRHGAVTNVDANPPRFALGAALQRLLANVDYVKRLALVAEAETPRGVELVGVARYEPTDSPDMVEVAFVVQDGWQGKGLGTVLLHDLLRAAEARGIRRFCAYVLADNTRMLDLLTRFTTIVDRTIEMGVAEVTFTPRTPCAPVVGSPLMPP